MSTLGRIVVGLSGGIDSTVAALLLRAAGYEPVGLTLRLRACTATDGERRSCCGPDAAGTAGAVARQLGIRHYVVDCHEAFDERVLQPCWTDFSRGRTPNPCVLCNSRVRFERLVAFADDVGAVAAATGHYARTEVAADGTIRLLRGVDPLKDQSYFLHAVPAALLARIRFPLGGLRKTEVRALARTHGLVNAERAESQDVCFAGPDGHFAESLRTHFDGVAVPGVVKDRDGRVLGTHSGVHRFTLGQRRGLGIAAGVPVRVCSIDAANGDVVVSADAGDLLAATCEASGCRWIAAAPAVGTECDAQIRYQQRPVRAVVERVEGQDARVCVRFAEGVSAVTPGQSLVLYDGDAVIGGGVIDGATAWREPVRCGRA